MTAKEYLGRLKKINSVIKNKEQELSELTEIVYTVPAIDNEKEKVRASTQNRGFDKVDKKVDLETEIQAQIESFMSLKHKIIDEIHSLDNSDYISVLFKRYVEFKYFEEIAVEMGYSYRHITRLHGYALKAFSDRILSI
jgi:hypothetical protein